MVGFSFGFYRREGIDMAKKYLLALLAVVILAVAAWFAMSPSAGFVAGKGGAGDGGLGVTAVAANTNVMRRGLTPEEIEKLGEGHFITKNGKQYFRPTSEEDKITRLLGSLLDDDKEDAALAEALRLRNNPNADVRSKAASAFHWLGVKGLEGLTSMLNDPDPEIAEEAYEYWRDVIGELESDYDKASLLVAATQTYGDGISKDVLEALVTDAQMLDDMEAIMALREMIKEVDDPAKVAIVGEAIDDMADESQPDLSKEKRIEQADDIVRGLEEQMREDEEILRDVN